MNYSTVETAKLIRKRLKTVFPGVKFSVRSLVYSMGSSIRVSWTDGPVGTAVRKETDPFAGAGFDGMIDLKYYKDAWLLPDGSVAYAKSRGTADSRGSVPAYDHAAPVPGARLVSFGVDHVFCVREMSDGFLRAVRDAWGAMDNDEKHRFITKFWGGNMARLVDNEFADLDSEVDYERDAARRELAVHIPA